MDPVGGVKLARSGVLSSTHGGDPYSIAQRLGVTAFDFLDASASLAPWSPRSPFIHLPRIYPDRSYASLVECMSILHCLESRWVIPGNGAAELFTWAARDACEAGISLLSAPGFADYQRALRCWQGSFELVPMSVGAGGGSPVPWSVTQSGDVVWITNPHNPTGQLWSRVLIEPLLQQFRLVICDEAFLPLVPNGEAQSLIPLVESHPNLVVIRSLTKLYGIAGLRLGYAVGHPDRLKRWSSWRDPWPVNGIAAAVGERLLRDPRAYHRWCAKVQRWTATEGAWLQSQLARLPGITPMPSAANFLLIRSEQSLVPLREALETRHRILLRDCRSFEGLGENWLRIGYQTRRNNRRIIRAMRIELNRLGYRDAVPAP